MKVTIIGTGLIGGSMAIALKEMNLAQHITGVDCNKVYAEKAIALGLVDVIRPLEEALDADLIILAVPVDVAENMLPLIMNLISNQVVMDVGSLKKSLLDVVAHEANRGRFVATHPMWGTEYSGPDAAVSGAFIGKAVVICEKEQSDDDALLLVENIYRAFGMKIQYMNAIEHDLHVAYVSHISHITSFALANTVLEKEKEEDKIFSLASGGFESTVRLAKSNPDMWVPIFMQNRENVLDVLNEHISQLKKFKSCLEKENNVYLEALIKNANSISKIIK
ncbi:MAG: prephenate dehydrogenase [Flavisolibacter sp.]|jgi:prephenate dehydrogenase|nr:prephenate dehydrogenase [Flavisolibacter sp.]